MVYLPIKKYIICETAILISSIIVGFDLRGMDRLFCRLCNREFARMKITSIFPTSPIIKALDGYNFLFQHENYHIFKYTQLNVIATTKSYRNTISTLTPKTRLELSFGATKAYRHTFSSKLLLR